MISRDDLAQDEWFNFWPSFADVMLLVVLVLVVILATITARVVRATLDLDHVRRQQNGIVSSIALELQEKVEGEADVRQIGESVLVRHYATMQQITFSDRVLFGFNEDQLQPRGRELLTIVGRALGPHVDDLAEIQIQGHTDTDGTDEYNLELASRRAIQVYRFFVMEGYVDPARQLMSATSFGEHKPVTRQQDESFDPAQLAAANTDVKTKANNRRIEMLLFYQVAQRAAK